MNRDDNIESLYQKAFSRFTVEPSPGLWQHLARKLAWHGFLRFSWSSLNVWYVSTLAVAGVAAWLLFKTPRQDTISESVPVIQQQQRESQPSNKNPGQEKAIVIETPATGQQANAATEKKQPAGGQKKKSEQHPALGQEKMQDTLTKAPLPVTKVPVSVQPEEKDQGIEVQQAKNPVVAFSMDNTEGCPPLRVQFTNRSENVTSLLWQFGDGGSSTQKDPVYIFDEPGTWVVTLEGRDMDNTLRIKSDTVKIFRQPVARFEVVKPQQGNEDLPVSFYNYSVDAVASFWDFGDGTVSDQHDPVHHYQGNGPYDVKLIATSADGCRDSMVLENAFEKNPYYIRFPDAFVPNPEGPCDGYYTEGMNINAVFHPVSFGVTDYQLRVFNRFGELVFESNEIRRGWDGYINGTLATPGVYIWKARGTYNDGKPFMKFGNLTLLKK